MIDAHTHNQGPVVDKSTANREMFNLAAKVAVFINPLDECQRLLGIIAWKMWELEQLPEDGMLDLSMLNEVEDAIQLAIAGHPDPQAAFELGHDAMTAMMYLQTKYQQAAGCGRAAEAARVVESRET